jgi:hypothetical protein
MAAAAIAGSILAGWVIDVEMYLPARWAHAVRWAVVHTDSGSSAVIGKPRRAGKDSDVFMHDQMNGSSSCSGASGLGELPEGGSGADPPVAHRTEQGDDVLEVAESCCPRHGDGKCG